MEKARTLLNFVQNAMNGSDYIHITQWFNALMRTHRNRKEIDCVLNRPRPTLCTDWMETYGLSMDCTIGR